LYLNHRCNKVAHCPSIGLQVLVFQANVQVFMGQQQKKVFNFSCLGLTIELCKERACLAIAQCALIFEKSAKKSEKSTY
jgi:hypothetical protein